MGKLRGLFGLMVLFEFVFLLFGALALPSIFLEKVERGDVIIAELGNPAVFDFNFTNFGAGENFEIYSLVGVSMTPKGTFFVGNESKSFEVKSYLEDHLLGNRGFFIFDYQIRGLSSGILDDELRVKIVEFEEVFEVDNREIGFGDESLDLVVRNTENANIEGIDLEIKSAFFEFKDKLDFEPFEEKVLTVQVDQDSFLGQDAGNYVVSYEFETDKGTKRLQSFVYYVEVERVTEKVESEGVIVKSDKISRVNEGNVPSTARVDVRRNALTRLFTSFSVEPGFSERSGFFVDYSWEEEIRPGEDFEVEVRTDYTLPFLILILIVVVALVVSKFSLRKGVVMRKGVSAVKTKGGEFALKVTLGVRANREIKDLEIIDKIPGNMKLFEKFGKPDKVDGKTRRLFWKVSRLGAGEERVFSYIIYSKLRVTGRFELQPGMVSFQSGGKKEHVLSNHAYFVADVGSIED